MTRSVSSNQKQTGSASECAALRASQRALNFALRSRRERVRRAQANAGARGRSRSQFRISRGRFMRSSAFRFSGIGRSPSASDPQVSLGTKGTGSPRIRTATDNIAAAVVDRPGNRARSDRTLQAPGRRPDRSGHGAGLRPCRLPPMRTPSSARLPSTRHKPDRFERRTLWLACSGRFSARQQLAADRMG